MAQNAFCAHSFIKLFSEHLPGLRKADKSKSSFRFTLKALLYNAFLLTGTLSFFSVVIAFSICSTHFIIHPITHRIYQLNCYFMYLKPCSHSLISLIH